MTPIDPLTAAIGGAGGAGAIVAFLMKFGGRIWKLFWKLAPKVKESLESGDSSASVETKTPLQKHSDIHCIHELLHKILDSLDRIDNRLMENGDTLKASMKTVREMLVRFDAIENLGPKK